MKEHFVLLKKIPSSLKAYGYFPPAQKFLLFLILIDFFFVMLHGYSILYKSTLGDNLNLRLDKDFGYAEMFQYFKFISISVLLAVLSYKEKLGVYFFWSLFFITLFFDDAFSFHEIYGAKFANYFDISASFGLRAQDLGELAVAAGLGLLFVLPLLYNIFFASKRAKEITLHFILLIGLLLSFGVGIDMLHSFLKDIPAAGILTIIEDGGEMIATTLILCYTFCLYLKDYQLIKKFRSSIPEKK